MAHKRIYISELADEAVVKHLASLTERVVRIKSNPDLPPPVSAHADMQMLMIEDTLITTRELYNSIKETFPDNIIITFAENNHTNEYPGDVNLNALYVRKCLFANSAYLDPTVKLVCERKGIGLINVKQGYAKCSTLNVGDDAIITADPTIAEAAEHNGIDTLAISAGNIVLPGYNYGFIGGASFYDPYSRTVYFFGGLDNHPDSYRITEFCKRHNTKVISCSTSPLIDLGGAVVIQ